MAHIIPNARQRVAKIDHSAYFRGNLVDDCDCRCRWASGRIYWTLLRQSSRNLARIIWINIIEREGELKERGPSPKVDCNKSDAGLCSRT
ncbi:hypothetical protein N7481_008376 [Penicillium waksmanii]|uniref:uncharacterized protein n=1 Tax=Penicillium waksmanii TaxID=69791 RepID=UPI002547F302|nr:uncharacterized protein N7481_008376 [Penicillium waksmanii]KAJ5981078.1 hypothetical protein N7481_008376 [Penicillium waksmanii]